MSNSEVEKKKTLALLRQSSDPCVDFLATTLRGSKLEFGKIIKLIDDLAAQLKTEQSDAKKKYCSAQFHALDDQKKGAQQ